MNDLQETEDERSAIVESMIDALMPPIRQPEDFTLSEYIERLRARGYKIVSRGPVRDRLEAKVQAGGLLKLLVWDNEDGRSLTVYRPIVKD